MNDHALELEKSKQPTFGPIYSLEPVKLETLKTYIKISLANSFIRPFKSSIGAFIPFNSMLDKSFCLYVNYWGLKKITIKNSYPLPLIDKLLDWLDRAKKVIQLDFNNTYH